MRDFVAGHRLICEGSADTQRRGRFLYGHGQPLLATSTGASGAPGDGLDCLLASGRNREDLGKLARLIGPVRRVDDREQQVGVRRLAGRVTDGGWSLARAAEQLGELE